MEPLSAAVFVLVVGSNYTELNIDQAHLYDSETACELGARDMRYLAQRKYPQNVQYYVFECMPLLPGNIRTIPEPLRLPHEP